MQQFLYWGAECSAKGPEQPAKERITRFLGLARGLDKNQLVKLMADLRSRRDLLETRRFALMLGIATALLFVAVAS